MKIYIMWVILLAALTSCNGKSVEQRRESSAPSVVMEQSNAISLPVVPDSLRDPQERAAYIAMHFWDAADFTDARLMADTAVVEQAFADYLSVLPLVREAEAAAAVDELVGRATDAGVHDCFADLALHYLDDPNSPMRNEELYVHFLRAAIVQSAIADADKLWARGRLEEALKNRPGTIAADFAIDLPGGVHTTLRKLLKENRVTMVMFYDPDCPRCKAVMADFSAVALPDGVGLLALDAESDRALFDSTRSAVPAPFRAGYVATSITDDGLYTLPATPTIYVMRSDGLILAKDCTPEQAYTTIFK